MRWNYSKFEVIMLNFVILRAFKVFVASIALLWSSLNLCDAYAVGCEKISTCPHNQMPPGVKCCWIDRTSVIYTSCYRISSKKDESVGRISFASNEHIEFLPIHVANQFPNLTNFVASYCSIREISANNFEGLAQLTTLDLAGNKILTIEEGVFQGLYQLQSIDLSNSIFISW